MTVAVWVKVYHGIALATDSAGTIRLANGSHQVYKQLRQDLSPSPQSSDRRHDVGARSDRSSQYLYSLKEPSAPIDGPRPRSPRLGARRHLHRRTRRQSGCRDVLRASTADRPNDFVCVRDGTWMFESSCLAATLNVGGRPRTLIFRLGVKWSQVQILSARPEKQQFRGGFLVRRRSPRL